MFSKPIRACLKLAAVIGPRVPDMRGKTVSSLSGAPHSCGDLLPRPAPGLTTRTSSGVRTPRAPHPAQSNASGGVGRMRTPRAAPVSLPARHHNHADPTPARRIRRGGVKRRAGKEARPLPVAEALPSPRRCGLLVSGKDGMIRLPTSVPARRPLRVRHIQGTRRAFRLLFGKQPGWTRRAFQAMFSPASPRGLFLSVRETSRKAPRLVPFPTFTASS